MTVRVGSERHCGLDPHPKAKQVSASKRSEIISSKEGMLKQVQHDGNMLIKSEVGSLSLVLCFDAFATFRGSVAWLRRLFGFCRSSS